MSQSPEQARMAAMHGSTHAFRKNANLMRDKDEVKLDAACVTHPGLTLRECGCEVKAEAMCATCSEDPCTCDTGGEGEEEEEDAPPKSPAISAVRDDNVATKDCSACNGEGATLSQLAAGTECEVCGGKGTVPVSEEAHAEGSTCDACGETRDPELPCPSCGNEAKTSEPEPETEPDPDATPPADQAVAQDTGVDPSQMDPDELAGMLAGEYKTHQDKMKEAPDGAAGWTPESYKKAWEKLGPRMRDCAAKMKGKVSDEYAFCSFVWTKAGKPTRPDA